MALEKTKMLKWIAAIEALLGTLETSVESSSSWSTISPSVHLSRWHGSLTKWPKRAGELIEPLLLQELCAELEWLKCVGLYVQIIPLSRGVLCMCQFYCANGRWFLCYSCVTALVCCMIRVWLYILPSSASIKQISRERLKASKGRKCIRWNHLRTTKSISRKASRE
jgi:hypothetical protein